MADRWRNAADAGILIFSMTKQEAAKFLGVGLRSLERYTSEGRISARKVRTRTGQVSNYEESDLARLKEELFEIERPAKVPPRLAANPAPSSAQDGTRRSETALALAESYERDGEDSFPPHPATHPSALAWRGGRIEAIVPAKASPSTPDPFVASIRLVLTIPEASLLTGFSAQRIKEAVREGPLKAQRIGRAWRIRRADLEAWVDGLF